MQKFNPVKLGFALALLAALGMILLGIAGNIGVYEGAVEIMQKMHMFFNPSAVGIITGIIEAAVMSFVGGYLFATIYNSVNK